MSKVPAYVSEGFRPAGPRRCQCTRCGETLSTNAFVLSKHNCASVIERRFRAAYEKARETMVVRPAIEHASRQVGITFEQGFAIWGGKS